MEILAEYERLKREEEERQLQLKTTPISSVQADIDATDLFALSVDDEKYTTLIIQINMYICDVCIGFRRSAADLVEIRRINATIELECPLTVKDTIVFGTDLTVENGLGQGAIATAYRRTINDQCWVEVSGALFCPKKLFKKCC